MLSRSNYVWDHLQLVGLYPLCNHLQLLFEISLKIWHPHLLISQVITEFVSQSIIWESLFSFFYSPSNLRYSNCSVIVHKMIQQLQQQSCMIVSTCFWLLWFFFNFSFSILLIAHSTQLVNSNIEKGCLFYGLDPFSKKQIR